MGTDITERQKEIIAVSLQLIAENGIQGLTIKNIAKKIGFTESAIYRHYENKIQILIAILDFFKENTERFFSKEVQATDSSITKIERLFLNHFKTFTATPSLVAVIFSEEIFRNEAILVEKMEGIIKMNSFVITNIIGEGQKNGEIRTDIQAAHLAVIVIGSLRLFVKQWQLTNQSFSLVDKGTEFMHSIKTLLTINN